MGLDNIPHVYPCREQGTAVISEGPEPIGGRIDCDATIAAGGCPWKRDADKRDRGTPTYGMMGTYCWFRGKSGTWMLEELEGAGFVFTGGDGFYGLSTQEEEGPQLPPEYCAELAQFMEDHAEAYARLHAGDEDKGKDAIEAYRYAAFWLRWVGETCGGSDTWY